MKELERELITREKDLKDKERELITRDGRLQIQQMEFLQAQQQATCGWIPVPPPMLMQPMAAAMSFAHALAGEGCSYGSIDVVPPPGVWPPGECVLPPPPGVAVLPTTAALDNLKEVTAAGKSEVPPTGVAVLATTAAPDNPKKAEAAAAMSEVAPSVVFPFGINPVPSQSCRRRSQSLK